MKEIGSRVVQVENKPGTISIELWDSIKEAIDNKTNTKIVVKGEEDKTRMLKSYTWKDLIVDGEEDLATLAVISLSKIGAKVIYGMPDKGMVVVDVNQQAKERANKILERMLVK